MSYRRKEASEQQHDQQSTVHRTTRPTEQCPGSIAPLRAGWLLKQQVMHGPHHYSPDQAVERIVVTSISVICRFRAGL